MDVTKTFNLYRNWLLSSDFHKQFYLHKLFTTHFIFYPFRTLNQVTYFTYLLIFHLFSFFQQSNDKTQVLLFPHKVLCFYVLDCIVHVSKSFEHPTHSKSTFSYNFLLFFPHIFPNLFQILYCFMYHTPRQFRPSLSLSFFHFFSTLPTILHLECCATPFILLFQQRNAHYHTSFFNSRNVPDSSFFFMLLLTHLRITSWNKQYFPAFFNLYSSS